MTFWENGTELTLED